LQLKIRQKQKAIYELCMRPKTGKRIVKTLYAYENWGVDKPWPPYER